MEATSRSNRIDPVFKDRPREQRTRSSFANIALVDRAPTHAKPLLYLPKRDIEDADLAGPKNYLDSFLGKGAFVLAGPILSIDRGNKRIFLDDDLIINYNHLIVCTAPRGDAFLAADDDTASHGAVQALADAMRCLTLRPLQLAAQQRSTSQRLCIDPTALAMPVKPVDSALLTCLHNPAPADEWRTYRWSTTERRLYEVQT